MRKSCSLNFFLLINSILCFYYWIRNTGWCPQGNTCNWCNYRDNSKNYLNSYFQREFISFPWLIQFMVLCMSNQYCIVLSYFFLLLSGIFVCCLLFSFYFLLFILYYSSTPPLPTIWFLVLIQCLSTFSEAVNHSSIVYVLDTVPNLMCYNCVYWTPVFFVIS